MTGQQANPATIPVLISCLNAALILAEEEERWLMQVALLAVVFESGMRQNNRRRGAIVAFAER